MKLSVLSSKVSLKGKRVLVRVDWNVPLTGEFAVEDSIKLGRTFPTIEDLSSRGAIVIVMTHLGRPIGRDPHFSTKKLEHLVRGASGMRIHFLPDELDTLKGLARANEKISFGEPGTIFLLENVRFLKGEETNAPGTAKALASLGDLFVNDAFASCHRAHASVVGVTKYLPSFAGPTVQMEVEGLSRLLGKPKRPFMALIGGAKLSTKMEVLTTLLSTADSVMVGGAMAHPFFAAKGLQIGKSFMEKGAIALAKKLLKHPKLLLPTDVVVSSVPDARARVVPVTAVKKTDTIGDIGTETMQFWASEIRKAKTIVWNGPVGMTEYPRFSHGSLVMARAISARSKGPCYGVVGGGDTLPIVMQSGMQNWIDHLSTGGGAMLEYLASGGKLPGLEALTKAASSKAKKKKV